MQINGKWEWLVPRPACMPHNSQVRYQLSSDLEDQVTEGFMVSAVMYTQSFRTMGDVWLCQR